MNKEIYRDIIQTNGGLRFIYQFLKHNITYLPEVNRNEGISKRFSGNERTRGQTNGLTHSIEPKS